MRLLKPVLFAAVCAVAGAARRVEPPQEVHLGPPSPPSRHFEPPKSRQLLTRDDLA
jgi:hypothetical protein